MTSKKSGKVAFVMASGGITGMAYEVGALRALDHAMVNRTGNNFDVYVGTSAGAVVAAFAAAGIGASTLAQGLAGTLEGFPPLERWRLYRPNVGELGTRARRVLAGSAAAAWASIRTGSGQGVPWLGSMIPSGLFTTAGLEAYIHDSLAVAGVPDRLDAIHADLQVVATELETGARVAFSAASHPDLAISRAVAASAAVPLLFRPVEIAGRRYVDGAVTGAAAIDVAVDRGATMVVVINGLVPMDTAQLTSHSVDGLAWPSVYDRGIRGIQNQVRRETHHEALVAHLRELGRTHPEVDLVLIEPRPDDEKMPFHQLMSFRARLIVLQHGYESVASGLLADWMHVSGVFARHGITLSDSILRRAEVTVPVIAMPDRKSSIGRLRRTALDRRLRHRGPAEVPLVPGAVAPEWSTG